MHKIAIAGFTAAGFLINAHALQATDILSQDSAAYELTITEGDTERSVELAALGEIRDVCSGCTIALEDGQTVEAKANDIVAIIDGKLIADE